MPGVDHFPTVIEDVTQQMRTNYMGIASFTMLIWDHVDTFADEVQFIWGGAKGPIIYLFFINRYLTPLGFIVNLIAYMSSVWTTDVCDRFIRFEGAMTVIGINIAAIMMLIRVAALYHGNWPVIAGVALAFAVEFSVNAWLLTKGQRVHHNPDSGVIACTMIFEPQISSIASASAWLPLLYDTLILGLTLFRTLPSLRNKNTSYIMKRLFQDGLIYYTAIFTVTLVLTLMIATAPDGLKNITAQLELLITVAMMSRITINLRKSVFKIHSSEVVKANVPTNFTQRSRVEPPPNIRIVAPGFNQTETDTMMDVYPLRDLSSPRGAPVEQGDGIFGPFDISEEEENEYSNKLHGSRVS